MHEFSRGQGEEVRPIPPASVSIAEGHLSVVESDDSFVADSDAVRVPAEVTQYLIWSCHGRLAVDDPGCTGRAAQALTCEGPRRG